MGAFTGSGDGFKIDKFYYKSWKYKLILRIG